MQPSFGFPSLGLEKATRSPVTFTLSRGYSTARFSEPHLELVKVNGCREREREEYGVLSANLSHTAPSSWKGQLFAHQSLQWQISWAAGSPSISSVTAPQ